VQSLICTVGLPRSGKSTWARATGFPVVSAEALRFALTGRAFSKPLDRLVWTLAEYMVQALFYAGHETVVLDADNHLRRHRDRWRSAEWDTVFHALPATAEECIQRAATAGHSRLVPVIRRMAAEIEPLGDDEPAY